MDDRQEDDLLDTLREQQARYIVGSEGRPVAVLLSIQEYEHYLDLLDDEADSHDPEIALRLDQAASSTVEGERAVFRDYLERRRSPHGQVSG